MRKVENARENIKITIYYNPDNYEDIDSLESYTFVIIIGIMFLIYPLLTKIL